MLPCRLICNPEDRIGRLGGATEIKDHPFFRNVRFEDLRRIKAPFEPRLQSNIDTSYFPIEEIPQGDAGQIAAREAAAAAAAASGEPEDNTENTLPFIGYTFRRFDAFKGA